MAKAGRKKKKTVEKQLPKAGEKPSIKIRELANKISESINKGKQEKNKRARPVRSGADADNADIIRYLSYGTSALDAATGGGAPCGRVTMVYGAPSAGKSLLSESAILSAQMRGGMGCIIDSEHTFNKARFSAKGGDVNNILFLDAKTLEQGFEYIEKTIKNLIAEPALIGRPIVVVWDTINTNQTSNKASGNEYAAGMMEAPRVIWDGFRKVTEIIASSNVAFIVLNQVYGDKVAPGGRGLQFYSSQILYLEEEDRYYSYRTKKWGKVLKAEIRKNKSNPPIDDFIYFCCDSMGMDDTMSIYFNLKARGKGTKLVDPGVFKKSGGWSNYTMLTTGEKIAFQGEKGFYQKSLEIEGFVDELAGRLWSLWPPADPASTEADGEFVSFFEKDNPWVDEGQRYATCLISDHQCPVSVWKNCRAKYWTDCHYDLADVEVLERVYHNPPEFDETATPIIAEPEPEEEEPEEDDS